LCTEAALNAIQRKYPQIDKSNDCLLLKPEEISVGLKEIKILIKSTFVFCLNCFFFDIFIHMLKTFYRERAE
ncbi:hypothetical protein GYMLUDRAFT_167472, partial [Collybiopsis luxurians FD-317 M1]